MAHTVKTCLWITSVASLCGCILALCYFTYSDKSIIPNAFTVSNVQTRSSLHESTTVFSNRESSIQSIIDSTRGFILVNKYFEQQIGAAMNLLTLTKWAKSIGALPVEPFVQDSTFCSMQVFHEQEVDKLLRFRDYFDIDVWNNKSVSINAMPLVPYTTFLTQKPNNVILVAISMKVLPKLVYINNDIMTELENSTKEGFLNFESKLKNFIQQNNMTVVRRVYMSFENHKAIHIYQFNKIIFGDFDPRNVVVWFQLWEGILKSLRIKIIEEEYHRTTEVFSMLQTSRRIMADSKKYAEQILNSSFGGYLAVSFRSVKRAKYFKVKSLLDQEPEFFTSCIQRLQHTISVMNNTKRIFLALDLGEFGDNKATKYLTSDEIKIIERKLFHILYDNTITLKRWEQQFIEVAHGITDSGYIATMQSTLLENSGCLIMFGGDSNFQRNLLTNYRKKYLNPCIREVCYIH